MEIVNSGPNENFLLLFKSCKSEIAFLKCAFLFQVRQAFKMVLSLVRWRCRSTESFSTDRVGEAVASVNEWENWAYIQCISFLPHTVNVWAVTFYWIIVANMATYQKLFQWKNIVYCKGNCPYLQKLLFNADSDYFWKHCHVGTSFLGNK